VGRVLLVLAILAVASCSQIGPGSGPSTVQTQPPVLTQPPAAVATRAPTPQPTLRGKAGAPFTYTDGWKVTLIRWQEQPRGSSMFFTPTPGMRLVAVFVRFDNGTVSTGHFNPLDFKLQDATGVRRAESFASVGSSRNDKLDSGDLAPGAFVSGSIVIEAPNGDARLEVIYESYPYVQATWELY